MLIYVNVIGWRFHKGVCNVDNMWMLLDEGSIIKGV